MATLIFHEQNVDKLWFRAIDGYSIQLGQFAGQPAAHIHPTAYGSVASAKLGIWLRDQGISPKLLVSVGVAYGIDPKTQNIGDVLFSRRVIDMDAAHKERNGEIILSVENSVYCLDEQCTAAWKSYCDNKQGWHWGTMLGKNAVLSDPDSKQRYLTAAQKIDYKDVIGGEMEYAGFFRAAEACHTDWRIIGIKGICDWGEEKNCYGVAANQLDNVSIKDNDTLKDLIQCYAADQALHALAELIEKRSSVLD